MFEGHDTTASGMTFILFMFALHKDAQKKVQEELDQVTEGDRFRVLTTDDLAKLKYLESCIRESMRIYPPVPYITRHLHEDTIIEVGEK